MNTYKSLAIGICIVTLFIAAIARAGDDDEASLISQIDNKVRDIKDKLDGASGNSSTSAIDEALNYARQIEDLADKLRSSNPQTDRGKTMGNYYRDYARKFEESDQYLHLMKEQQLRQANDRLAEKCANAEQRLRDDVARFVDKNDPEGITKIPELAENAARDYREAFKRDGELDRAMADWASRAKNFSESDGGWSDVSSKLRSDVDAIWADWHHRYEDEAKSEDCGDLVKGTENPLAVRALAQLVGSDGVRKGLIKDLEVQIKKTSDALKDVDRRSDDASSQLQDAQSAVAEVVNILGRLRQASGEDTVAKSILDSWPDKMGQLKDSIEALRKLKANQHVIDRGVEACGRSEAELRDLIKDEIDHRDEREEGWTRIDEKAKVWGEIYKAKLEKAQETKSYMESWKTDAQRWTAPSGYGWSDVKTQLNEAADGTLKYYVSMFDQVGVACRQLSFGTQHPEVKRAAGQLKEYVSTRNDDYVKLRDRAKKFANDVKGYRTLLAEDDEKIHELVCVKGSSRADDDMEDAINEIADRWASQLMSDWHIIEPEAEQIKRDADVLIAGKVPNARKIKRSIENLMASITKSVNGLNQGSNDPLIKKAIQCGISKHASMGSCTLRKVAIESSYCNNPNPTRKQSGCEIDCINGCTVIEFKPANDAAREAGQKQAREYTEGLRRWFRTVGDKMFEGKLESLRSCVKGDGDQKELVVKNGEVETYNFCDCFPDLTEGVSRDQPSVEIPDRDR